MTVLDLMFQYQILKIITKNGQKKLQMKNTIEMHKGIWQHILHIPPAKILFLLVKKTKNTSHTKQPTFQKMEV